MFPFFFLQKTNGTMIYSSFFFLTENKWHNDLLILVNRYISISPLVLDGHAAVGQIPLLNYQILK